MGAMAHQQPLRPDEDEYATEVVSPDVAPAGDPLETGAATEREVSQPWITVGLVLLAIFLAILAWAVLSPLLS
jgi:hypothetical protein